MNEIIKKVREDNHTAYMACSQTIDWIESGFGIETEEDGFIVQKVIINQVIDNQPKTTHYYEAWCVQSGVCKKESADECHDMFCIGHPYDYTDELRASIGHEGRIEFIPEVYWIRKENALYSVISAWDINTVPEANGLKSAYATDDLIELFSAEKRYARPQFIHEWEFKDPTTIFDVVLNYCKTQWNPNKDIDRRNFYQNIKDFFPNEAYSEIKEKIIECWERDEV